MKKVILVLIVVGVIGAGALGAMAALFLGFPAGPAASTSVFEVPPGASLTRVANDLDRH